MDEYVVRLDRAASTLTRPEGSAGEPGAPSTPVRARRKRWPRMVVILAVLVFVLGFHRDTAKDLLFRAADTAKEPIHRLRGEEDLNDATEALGDYWSNNKSFVVTQAELAERYDRVAWGETVTFRTCLGGRGAILHAKTAKGDVSRLVITGVSRGDVEGKPDCPASRDNIEPWSGL